MRLVLDGETAYEYWMHANPRYVYEADSSRRQRLTQFDGLTSLEVSQAINRQDGIPGTLHLMVGSAGERRNSHNVECHVWSREQPLPPKSLYCIGPGLYAVSPELCLVRIAPALSYPELLHRMTNMLGLFAFDFWERMELVEREPITTIRAIDRYLHKVDGAKGIKAVRRALSCVQERSRSPRETDLCLNLGMPARQGGQALPPFEVNRRIELTDQARSLTTKRYLECDVVWMSKHTVVEYNSDEWHLNTEQTLADLEKITALQRMGMTVLPVTTRQLADYAAFKALVQGLRKALGVRDQESPALDRRRMRLHADLMEVERREREQPVLGNTARWQFLQPRLDQAEQ